MIAKERGMSISPLSNKIGISSVKPSTDFRDSSFTGINLIGILTLSPSSKISKLYLSIKSFTLKDKFIKFYGSHAELLNAHGISADKIIKSILKKK